MNPLQLLTRDQFREGVFARDNYKCVFCGLTENLSAHHILERRLFSSKHDLGGYYISNGATVCAYHHLECESTVISVEEVREACGITKKVIPDHMYDDHVYDKWGNIILPNGQRMVGELFFDESVQKILRSEGILDCFTHYVKYPRTLHAPWSLGMHDDDRMQPNMNNFVGKRVIVTVKMDGENTSMYSYYIHARSIDGRSHPSRDWVKQFHAQIAGDIPIGWRICAENVYAKHSIHYDDLESYLYGFSIWNEKNVCLSWDETIEWFDLLGITPVPVLYDGIYDENAIQKLWDPSKYDSMEGYVIRLADSFTYGQFRHSIAKFVRPNHVQTVKHWMYGKPVVKNLLKGSLN